MFYANWDIRVVVWKNDGLCWSHLGRFPMERIPGHFKDALWSRAGHSPRPLCVSSHNYLTPACRAAKNTQMESPSAINCVSGRFSSFTGSTVIQDQVFFPENDCSHPRGEAQNYHSHGLKGKPLLQGPVSEVPSRASGSFHKTIAPDITLLAGWASSLCQLLLMSAPPQLSSEAPA